MFVTFIFDPSFLHMMSCIKYCTLHQVPVLLPIFQSNSKFDQNIQCSGLKCTLPITTGFCTCNDSVTVVTCTKFCCDWLSIFLSRALQILIAFRIPSKYDGAMGARLGLFNSLSLSGCALIVGLPGICLKLAIIMAIKETSVDLHNYSFMYMISHRCNARVSGRGGNCIRL